MSCLFNSLSRFVGCTHQQLRNTIVQYLASNPKLMDSVSANEVVKWTENADLAGYLRGMQQTSTWGGAIEIKAFCDLYSMKIVVVVLQTGKQIEFVGKSMKNGTAVVEWNGGHYTPKYRQINVFDVLNPRHPASQAYRQGH